MRRELAIATNILSDRLRRLVDARVLERIPCGERNGADYVLTERGRDLFSVVVTMMRWGDEWLAGAEGPPLVLHHRRCGRRLAAKVVCDKCGIELRPAEVRYRTTTA